MTGRLFLLDNLRSTAIVLVIALHAAMVYMAYAPTWWYVVDPDQSLLFTALVLLLDVPIMPVLFFVAGFFALQSLRKRGPAAFARDKVIRLGLPWAVGALLLAPLVTYMYYVSRGILRPFFDYWIHDFWGPFYQQSVYWYLGVLFALFLGLGLAYAVSGQVRGLRDVVTVPSGRFFLLVLVAIAVPALALSPLVPVYPVDAWRHAWVLVYQPVRVPLYIGFFLLGIHARRSGWFTAGGYRPEPGPWGWGCVVIAIAYLAVRFQMPDPATTPPVVVVASIVLFCALSLTAVMAGAAIFLRAGTGAGRAWTALAGNSYGIHYLHPLILFPLAWLLTSVALPGVLKWIGLVLATVLISGAGSALILRRVPGLRAAFR